MPENARARAFGRGSCAHRLWKGLTLLGSYQLRNAVRSSRVERSERPLEQHAAPRCAFWGCLSGAQLSAAASSHPTNACTVITDGWQVRNEIIEASDGER